ncbi:GNAT family N-acetyltransferase [Mesobacillus zeae]|uniref:N-acetyltransferase n=1 Tax=Mesobacillus zeae TaxID=1917180 RepID=A0A398BDS1_9BACI|nr:GNAT family protein [Mesobacillus zeae]RID85890.1 N-acetyltransferase [Mesobacillus zeae]
MKIENVLNGETVQLVAMEKNHIAGLWEAAKPDQIWTHMATKISSYSEMESAVEQALAEKEKGLQFPFVVVERSTGRIIGSTRYLDISTQNRSLEIGWTWYNPAFWRTRVNTECKLLLLEHVFEKLKMNRVCLKTDERNIRSQRAIERIGGVKEGVLRKDKILADGFARNTVYFSILPDEWPQVKERLNSRLKIKK